MPNENFRIENPLRNVFLSRFNKTAVGCCITHLLDVMLLSGKAIDEVDHA